LFIAISFPIGKIGQQALTIEHRGRYDNERHIAKRQLMAGDFDLLIVGGGINGAGIARDAAGRGLRVMLVEQDDLASHTSSASTKLIHGGLRYLEYGEFRLVREALIERDRLLAIAPHIIWPLEFVMPMGAGSRPGWLIRLGLFLYDHLGGRTRLSPSRGVRLDRSPLGASLKPDIVQGFRYSDCWVEDSRLVVLNALDARERGADIRTRTRFVGAAHDDNCWRVTVVDQADNTPREITTRAIVNAAGPWVGNILRGISGNRPTRSPRLVKGSHIIVSRRLGGDRPTCATASIATSPIRSGRKTSFTPFPASARSTTTGRAMRLR
jgi:glycerol-3-phosphate dehydrogenase